MSIITTPFGYLLGWLYQFTNNYGLALIFFAVIVQLVLLPATTMSKKSTMKMSRMQPKIQAIQRKYADDKQKQQEAIRELQMREGAGMGCGGCLWSLLPLLILIPLYNVVKEPITYILQDAAHADGIINVLKEIHPEKFTDANKIYWQMIAAGEIKEHSAAILAQLPDISARTLNGINFDFLGINLGTLPDINVFGWTGPIWSLAGGVLIPLLSAAQQILQMKISQKMNNSVITDDKGMYDDETAQNSQANQTSKVMTWMMPLFSLWIGLTVPVALSLYWMIGGIVRMVEDIILTKHYRKVYDAEDAERRAKFLEEEAIEAEKERIRAEKRAANPDGITENTSKKKLQKAKQQEAEAAKAAAKKEYDAKRGVVAEEPAKPEALSGIPERPFCKGRAYDPNRYSSEATEDK